MSNDWRRSWNVATQILLTPQDYSEFGKALCDALSGVTGFSHAVIFGYPPKRRPIYFFGQFANEDRSSAVSAYIRGTFLVDPFYEAVKRNIEAGVYRMEDLAPDEFYDTVGAHPGYVSPCVSSEPGVLSEEIGFFAHLGQGYYTVASLMRDAGSPPFSEAEMDTLREIAPTVCAAMRINFDASYRKFADPALGTKSLPQLDLPEILAQVSQKQNCELTNREIDVAELILTGNSSQAIADQLSISASTVKIHRRNIYQKLSVSTQGAFFALVLDNIMMP